MNNNPYASPGDQELPKRSWLIRLGVVFLILAIACLFFTIVANLAGWRTSPDRTMLFQGFYAVFSAQTPPLLIVPFTLE